MQNSARVVQRDEDDTAVINGRERNSAGEIEIEIARR
jgi:hypothetical protein